MDREHHKSSKEILAEVESSQKAILWEDASKGGRSVDAFLWNGDPHATPVQRAGLVIFGLGFFLLFVVGAFIPFLKQFEDGWAVAVEFLFAAVSLAISARLFRNALKRPKVSERHSHRE